MRLLCRWFCRLIGVGSALDMVRLYLMTLLCIFGVFMILLPEDVDGKKHRSSHRHAHHRHHHNHRKHPSKSRTQLSLNKINYVVTNANYTLDNFNGTKIIETTPWIFDQTSTSSIPERSFYSNEGITSSYRNDNSTNVTLIPNFGPMSSDNHLNSSESEDSAREENNLRSSVLVANSSRKTIESNDLFDTDDHTKSSITIIRNIAVNSQITIGIIDESTTEKFANSFENSSQSRKSEEIKTNDDNRFVISNVSIDDPEIVEDRVVKDLRKLFGSSDDDEKSSNDVIPFVNVIRKKLSSSSKNEEKATAYDKTKKATLLELKGPSITNDPEEINDFESKNAVHLRVKRDGSELDDDRSALASFDSTYLRNLEDSFALSALEIQSRESRKLPESFRRDKRQNRENTDLSVDGVRIKRDTEFNVEEDVTENDRIEPIDKVSVDDENNPNINVNERENVPSSESTANPSPDDNGRLYPSDKVNEFDRSGHGNLSSLDSRRENNALSLDTRLTAIADSIPINFDSISRNRINDINPIADNSSTVHADLENRTNSFSDRSQTSTTGIFLSETFNAVTRNEVNEDEHESQYNSSTMYSDRGNKSDYFPTVTEVSGVGHLLKNTVNTNIDDVPIADPYIFDLGSTNDSTPKSAASTPADLFANKPHSILENTINVTNRLANNSSTLTSVQYFIQPSESPSSHRLNEIQPNPDNSHAPKNNAKTIRDEDTGRDESSINDASARRSQASLPDNSVLKDENSISNHDLDDVYPDTIRNPEDSSALVQLVRTKRFGDGIVVPEAAEASYANEADEIGGMANEPYAEDNRIIDSMLSKVDYRSVDELDQLSVRNDDERMANEAEVYARETRDDDDAMREKRGGFRKRKGKKKKKKHKKKKKKKNMHRGRNKRRNIENFRIDRDSRDLSKRNYDLGDSPLRMKRGDEEGIISSTDEKRRGESEDANDEYFCPDIDENYERARREIREGDSNGENEERNSAGAMNARIEANVREKRNSDGLRDVKTSKNSRGTGSDVNRKEVIADERSLKTEAVESIRDIRQFVVALLTKVDELNNYIAESSGDEKQIKESEATAGMSYNASNAVESTGVPSRVVEQIDKSRSAENFAPKQVDAVKQSAPCWKHPTLVNIKSQPPKNNRPARYLRGHQCLKNPRRKRKSRRKWDRWTDWSSCSVTCGRGRQIRWRHCVKNCSTAETEMEEKACQLPACAPGKFLGIFG